MNKQKIFFLAGVFFFALSGIAYEIIAASVLSVLLGATVFYFSLTIGVYLAALGIGAWASSKVENNLVEKVVKIGTVSSLLGGALVPILFWSFSEALWSVSWLVRRLTEGPAQNFETILSLPFWSFNIFAFGLLSAIGVLMGFCLPLFSRLLHKSEKLKDALGKIFFLDYFGSLVSSVALPIFLFPRLGLVATSFLIGILNIFGTAMFIICAPYLSQGKIKKTLSFALAAAFLFNLAGLIFSSSIEGYLERRQFNRNEILYYHQSPYQRIDFVKMQNGKIKFYINGAQQYESGNWDAAYHESFAHPILTFLVSRDKSLDVLVMGSGDGLLLREILKYPEVKSVTLVDIDRAVIDATRNLDFSKELTRDSFSDNRVNIEIADAFEFVQRRDIGKFDAIFIGFPAPSDLNLQRLYSKEFYDNLDKFLTPGGLGVVQVVGYEDPLRWQVAKALSTVNFSVLPYHPPPILVGSMHYAFGFLIFSKNLLTESDFINGKLSVATRFIDSGNLKGIFDDRFFPGQNSPQSVEALSIFRPAIEINLSKMFRLRFLNNFRSPFSLL